MIILIDTREQLPLDFGRYECEVEYTTLSSGDYSVKGFDIKAAIERKSEDDLLGSITQGRKRFEAELARLRGYELKVVVCETNWHRLAKGLYRSQMDSYSCMQSLIGLSVRYQIQFIMAENRAGAAYFTYHTLRHYLKQKEFELKQAMKHAVTAQAQSPAMEVA